MNDRVLQCCILPVVLTNRNVRVIVTQTHILAQIGQHRVIREMGFGLVIGFIENLQIVSTSDNSNITNSHIQQFTRARTKPS
jgi:hypothetical protein